MTGADDLAILGAAECPGCGHIGDHGTGCHATPDPVEGRLDRLACRVAARRRRCRVLRVAGSVAEANAMAVALQRRLERFLGFDGACEVGERAAAIEWGDAMDRYREARARVEDAA